MTEKLEFDGERFTPECVREIRYEHMHRYALASEWCKDKVVLDAACGEGYGSAMLARVAKNVTGVDLAAVATDHARKRYQSLPNVEFLTGDVCSLPFEDNAFDVIVSFETLEHLGAHKEMLHEFRRVLRTDGFLVLSSPDKAEYSDRLGYQNEFHVRELYREELESLLSSEFQAFRILGQKLVFHSAIWSMDELQQVECQTQNSDESLSSGRIPHAPVYFIALCSAAKQYLPDTRARLFLFDDAEETVYQHYHHEIRKNMAAGGLLAERDREIEELKQGQASPKRSWAQRIFGKD